MNDSLELFPLDTFGLAIVPKVNAGRKRFNDCFPEVQHCGEYVMALDFKVDNGDTIEIVTDIAALRRLAEKILAECDRAVANLYADALSEGVI
jgi:hypothetical protein